MFDDLLEQYWAISDSFAIADWFAKMRDILAVGPVDDAEREGLPMRRHGNVAVIHWNSVLVRSAPAWMSRYLTSANVLIEAFKAADRDEEVDQIVLVIDTPGGSVMGMIELGDVIDSLQTPIITQGNGSIYSAGYYIAAKTQSIYVRRLDCVGSIGVKTTLFDSAAHYEQEGIRVIPVDTGEHKSTGEPGVPISESQVAHVQSIVDRYMDDFLNVVVEGRGMTRNDLVPLADGRIYFPEQALETGLIDGIQDIDETFAAAAGPQIRRTRAARQVMNANRAKALNI
jgi:protease-4